MADFISAVANAANAQPKQLIEVANPAQSGQAGENGGLSAAAKSALNAVGDMQSDFQTEMDVAQNQGAAALGKSRGISFGETSSASGDAVIAIQAQMDVAVRVQQQLTKFVMVSSVSSSFGRNLNMFLRGQ